MRVRCHKNLHRGDWSITVKGKVVAHVAEIILRDVRFIVRESARLRVIARKCREVHAWVEGDVLESCPEGRRVSLTYNPYLADSFVERESGKPAHDGITVHFTKTEGAVAVL